MNTSIICLLAGPIISGLVSLLKKVSFVDNHPKTVAFVASAIVGGVSTFTGDTAGVGISELAQCILIPFAGAVATYEAVTRQVQKIGVDTAPPSGDYEKDRI